MSGSGSQGGLPPKKRGFDPPKGTQKKGALADDSPRRNSQRAVVIKDNTLREHKANTLAKISSLQGGANFHNCEGRGDCCLISVLASVWPELMPHTHSAIVNKSTAVAPAPAKLTPQERHTLLWLRDAVDAVRNSRMRPVEEWKERYLCGDFQDDLVPKTGHCRSVRCAASNLRLTPAPCNA